MKNHISLAALKSLDETALATIAAEGCGIERDNAPCTRPVAILVAIGEWERLLRLDDGMHSVAITVNRYLPERTQLNLVQ